MEKRIASLTSVPEPNKPLGSDSAVNDSNLKQFIRIGSKKILGNFSRGDKESIIKCFNSFARVEGGSMNGQVPHTLEVIQNVLGYQVTDEGESHVEEEVLEGRVVATGITKEGNYAIWALTDNPTEKQGLEIVGENKVVMGEKSMLFVEMEKNNALPDPVVAANLADEFVRSLPVATEPEFAPLDKALEDFTKK